MLFAADALISYTVHSTSLKAHNDCIFSQFAGLFEYFPHNLVVVDL